MLGGAGGVEGPSGHMRKCFELVGEETFGELKEGAVQSVTGLGTMGVGRGS